jgi:hypothetical protein
MRLLSDLPSATIPLRYFFISDSKRKKINYQEWEVFVERGLIRAEVFVETERGLIRGEVFVERNIMSGITPKQNAFKFKIAPHKQKSIHFLAGRWIPWPTGPSA